MVRTIAVLVALAPTVVLAQDAADPVGVEDASVAADSRSRAAADATFGPPIVIERIEIIGNTSTARRVIVRALPFAEGDAMRAGDPRLRAARIKILALGYFREVSPIRLSRGSSRGRVVVTIRVVERGTVILNRLWFGTSLQTPWWVGVDAGERNFYGTGMALGGALVFAGEGEAPGSRSQRAGEIRLGDPSILGTRIGASGSLHWVRASEPYRVAGAASDDRPEQFEAFDYSRIGGRLGGEVSLTPLSRLSFGARLERVDARLPAAPTRMLEDGTSERVELFLRPGVSRVVTASVGFDRDSRSDPVLPYDGDRVQLYGELGTGVIGSSYDYGLLAASYERWWTIRSVTHVVSIHLTGGVVLGDAPLFDRFHVGDLNRLVTPRALGLTVSTTPARDLFGTAADDIYYGEVGGVAELQYSYRLFRSRRFVYGGDLFAGAGVWALANAGALRVRDRPARKALPIDLLVDVGLRLDTEVGIFELTLANGLGRVPL
jgi:outer membrane protein assembly factor BamA